MKRSRARSLVVIIVLALLLCLTSGFVITVAGGRASAQAMEPRFYDIGSPALKDIWVDPAHGDDGHTGDERGSALRSLSAAWDRIPSGATLSGNGYRVLLAGGTIPAGSVPTYMESRYGTRDCPVIIQAADGRGTVTLQGDLNVFDCTFLYLIDFNIVRVPQGEALHLERCDHVLARGMLMSGGDRAAQETVKVNQCRYFYLEQCDVSGAWNVDVDLVAVQYGHIQGNRIHDAGDWCMYLKGGSAYFLIEGNELFDGDTGGFTAGQGTGFEYMESPWIHYETTDIKFVNNVVHDTVGAGMGVNGSYNVLLAYNTLYRVGQRSHAIEVTFGERGCDGDTAKCAGYLAQGGWGTATTGSENQQPIPNRDVFVYDNVLYNPPGYQSQWSQFSIPGPRNTAPSSNIPSPARSDDDLRIAGNIIWNGPADLPLGVEDPDQGGQPSNPTCNATQLRADNAINSLQPQLANPVAGDYSPVAGGTVFSLPARAIPSFPGGDRAAPPVEPDGVLENLVSRDYYGSPRQEGGPPGAFAGPGRSFYFAEGYTGEGFSEYLCIANPEATRAGVEVTYMFDNGQSQRQQLSVAPGSRTTINVNEAVGPWKNVSVKVTSDSAIVVERPMYFNYHGLTGGHDVQGASAPATAWYFAEGYTGPGFDQWVCVLNPCDAPASVDFHFQTSDAGEVVKSGGVVPAMSRSTFKVNDLLGGGVSNSLKLVSDRPIVAERPMYFDYVGNKNRHWDGGHCVMGATGLSSRFLFAEGTTRAGFDEWLTLQNPNAFAISVTALYRFAPGQGGPIEKSYRVDAGRRVTVFVADETGPDKDTTVELDSTDDFLAERPMYFKYEGVWDGGECAAGATSAASDWYFAEGYTGPGFVEWLCLLNPGEQDAVLELSYYTQEAGALSPRTISVPAGGRLTVKVNDSAGAGYQVSCRVRVVSGPAVVVERPMYFDYHGLDGGHDAFGYRGS